MAWRRNGIEAVAISQWRKYLSSIMSLAAASMAKINENMAAA
jgi:hypothetical protein